MSIFTLAALACSFHSAIAVSSSTMTASYSICQFFSSIAGATPNPSSMTLPLCPTSVITYSYTIPPEELTTSTFTARGSVTTSNSLSLCQFFSSISGITESSASSMTLPPCPSSLQNITYIYSVTTTSSTPPSNTVAAVTTASATGSSSISVFTGLAAPPAGVGKAFMGGVGAMMAAAVVLL
jgi:hypothetical protein